MEEKGVRLTILYNNVGHDERLETGWGMACLVEGAEKTVLFDTGGDGGILLRNMEALGREPGRVEVVVLSHNHSDHTGGLGGFLGQKSAVEVVLPQSFPASFMREVERQGAEVTAVEGPQRIAAGLYTTGEVGTSMREQALIVETARGLVLVTGCSHPGVGRMAERAAQARPGEPFYLVTGGFHLGKSRPRKIEGIIGTLRKLGVKKAAPSHCTGEAAVGMFREAWQEDFLELGCGARITIGAE